MTSFSKWLREPGGKLRNRPIGFIDGPQFNTKQSWTVVAIFFVLLLISAIFVL